MTGRGMARICDAPALDPAPLLRAICADPELEPEMRTILALAALLTLAACGVPFVPFI